MGGGYKYTYEVLLTLQIGLRDQVLLRGLMGVINGYVSYSPYFENN